MLWLTEWSPRAKAERGGELPPIAARLTCAVYFKQAGLLEPTGMEVDHQIRRESFTGVLTAPVSSGAFVALHDAMSRCDSKSVFALDQEYAPFYCPPAMRSIAAPTGGIGMSSTTTCPTGTTRYAASAPKATNACWQTESGDSLDDMNDLIVVTRDGDLEGVIGELVRLRGIVANTRFAMMLGVEVASHNPDLRGQNAVATGRLVRDTVTQEAP